MLNLTELASSIIVRIQKCTGSDLVATRLTQNGLLLSTQLEVSYKSPDEPQPSHTFHFQLQNTKDMKEVTATSIW